MNYSVLQLIHLNYSVLQLNELQCVAVNSPSEMNYSVLQLIHFTGKPATHWNYSVLQFLAVCCSVLQSSYCSPNDVLQSVAEWHEHKS